MPPNVVTRTVHTVFTQTEVRALCAAMAIGVPAAKAPINRSGMSNAYGFTMSFRD